MFEGTKGAKEERMNALWGKGERAGARGAKVRTRIGVLATLVAALALAAPMTAGATKFTYTAPTVDTSSTLEEESTFDSVLEEDAAWSSVAWAS